MVAYISLVCTSPPNKQPQQCNCRNDPVGDGTNSGQKENLVLQPWLLVTMDLIPSSSVANKPSSFTNVYSGSDDLYLAQDEYQEYCNREI